MADVTAPSLNESLLESIGSDGPVSNARYIHDYIIRNSLEQNVFLSNALVQAYNRGGSLDEARVCLDCLHSWNHITLNLAIQTCARCKHLAGDAFRLFSHAMHRGAAFTRFISATILSACHSHRDLFEGRLIHALIASHGFEYDVVVSTALINMYGNCASFDDAWKTFKDMPERNTASWNVMGATNISSGLAKESLEFIDMMQNQAIALEKVTFLNAFDACALARDVAKAKQTHARIEGSNLNCNLMVRTSLMKMYGKLDRVDDAQRMFERMPERDMISWNALIALYAQQRRGEFAIGVFNRMQHTGVRSNEVTLVSILDACADESDSTMGDSVFNFIVDTGYELDVILGTALVNMYGKCKKVEDAQRVFDMMPERNVITWNAMMTTYVQDGDGDETLQLFEHMKQSGIFVDSVTLLNVFDACALELGFSKGKQTYACMIASGVDLDVVLGSSLIGMYGKCDDLEGTRLIFDKMSEHNAITFVNMLSACAAAGCLDGGKALHECIVNSRIGLDVVINTALVNMYGKCGMLAIAWKVFQYMPERSSLSWNAMISAYTQHGQGKQALELFEMMRWIGVVPDDKTFSSVLSACSHAGLVDEGCYYFSLMHRFYDIRPHIHHYNCFIDMLGRLGMVDEAECFMKTMPVTATSVSWATLMGAWQNQSGMDWAQKCVTLRDQIAFER